MPRAILALPPFEPWALTATAMGAPPPFPRLCRQLRRVGALASLLLLASCSPADEISRCRGCNLIVISVDTLRADHLSCQGHVRDTSPAICRYFASGLLFENAISQSPWTGPAHASMFTSLYPYEHGLNYGPHPPTVDDHPDLFTILQRLGYFTAAIHGGGFVTPALPTGGLDAIVTGKPITFRRGALRLVNKALVEKPPGQPFALFLHGYDPHLAYKPTRNWFTPLEPDLDAIANENRLCAYETLEDGSTRIDPATIPPDDRARSYFQVLYDSEIRDVDRSLQRLFEHLERTGLAERTVVILTSDHGEELFERGGCDHVKTVYNELLHVPLMLRIPGAPAARRREFVPASISLAPTALDALGFDPTAHGFTGRSLLTPRPVSEPFFAETTFHYDHRVLRRFAAYRGSRKLILDAETGHLELFDLARDPHEQTDLAGQGLPPADRELEKALREYVRRSLASTRTEGVELDCETVRSLRSLGYLDDSDSVARCP